MHTQLPGSSVTTLRTDLPFLPFVVFGEEEKRRICLIEVTAA